MWVETIRSQVVPGVCFFPEQSVLDLVIRVQSQCEVEKVDRFPDLLISKLDSEWFRKFIQKVNKQIELSH